MRETRMDIGLSWVRSRLKTPLPFPALPIRLMPC